MDRATGGRYTSPKRSHLSRDKKGDVRLSEKVNNEDSKEGRQREQIQHVGDNTLETPKLTLL